jgi:outer membrane protein TolC
MVSRIARASRTAPSLCALSILGLGSAAPAETVDFVARPDSALAVTLARIEGEPLELPDALALSIEQATAAREATAALRAAEAQVRRERGAFDPVLFADVEVSSVERPIASDFEQVNVLADEQTSSTAGARIVLPFGTEVEAAVETRRLETNSAFVALSPEYTATGTLGVRQPILKGFGPSTRSDLTSAELEEEAASSRREDALLRVVAEVTTAYWDLYAAERDYAVQQLIVERAQALLSEAELRAQAGLSGPSEVATARVFVAEQRLAAFDREEELDEISDGLATLNGRRPAGVRFRPASEPAREFPVDGEAELLERALRFNRELRSAEKELEALEALERGARWDAFPELDVEGSLGGNGLSGRDRDDGTAIRGGGTSDAVADAVSREFPAWSVGVRLSLPIGFREGRGERDRLRAEVERSRERVVALRREIEESVRSAHRRLVNGTMRLEIAREGVDASLETVRIGQIEFRNGRTTAFELVRLGADVALAQQRYSDALVRTAKAAADLERLAPASGSLAGRIP